MDILQRELDEAHYLWNTHPIVKSSTRFPVYGVPNELFYIPEIHGKQTRPYILSIEQNVFSMQGMKIVIVLLMCKTFISASSTVPSPVPDEFIDVADILMNENGWLMPDNFRDALELYLNLVSVIN